MTLVCDVCQQPIGGDDYRRTPAGEPCHAGECYADAHDDLDRDADPDYLDAADVVENFQAYNTALEAERQMNDAVIAGLEAGQIDVDELVESLPSPTPMEAWQSDRWRDLDASDEYDHLPTFDIDHE